MTRTILTAITLALTTSGFAVAQNPNNPETVGIPQPDPVAEDYGVYGGDTEGKTGSGGTASMAPSEPTELKEIEKDSNVEPLEPEKIESASEAPNYSDESEYEG